MLNVLVDVEWNPSLGLNAKGMSWTYLNLNLFNFFLYCITLNRSRPLLVSGSWPLLFHAHTCLVLTSSLVYVHSLRVSIPPGMSPYWLALVLHLLAYDTAINIGRNIWGEDKMCLHTNLKNHKNVSRSGLQLNSTWPCISQKRSVTEGRWNQTHV
jgi:hypothetical protein